MSYYSSVEFFYMGDEQFRGIEPELPAFAKAQYVSTDIIGDLLALMEDGQASVKVYAEDVIGIFTKIAKLDPDVHFVVRGRGESPLDVWVREFRDGVAVLEQGPPPNAI